MSHGNSEERRDGRGLRPAIPAACRAFLLALEQDSGWTWEPGSEPARHAAECPRCAEHVAFRSRFARLLAVRPSSPAALLSRDLLEATQERIVAAIEATPVGQWVAGRVATPEPGGGWPEPLLDSAVARAMGSAPQSPSGVAWAEVRESVIAVLGSRRTVRARWGLWLGIAGIAATAVFSVMLLARGTPNATTIVFTDLDAMPGVEFSVIRYGALR